MAGRNLLELTAWSLYCGKGRVNARRLYEDAGRDVLGIYSAFEKWGTATVKEAEFINLFSSAKQELSIRAAADGIASLDGDFKKVNEAAEEGHRGAFQAQLQNVVEFCTSDRHANPVFARRSAERAPARLFLQPGLSLFPRRIRFPRKSAGRSSISLTIRNQ